MSGEHFLIIQPEDGGEEIKCPHPSGTGSCALRTLDGPDMDEAINRYGMIVIDSWPPGDFPLLPPGVDDLWDEEWQVTYDDLRYSVDHEEWHPPTGDCGVAEAFFAGTIEDRPRGPGRYSIDWDFEGEFEDWWIEATFTEVTS